MNAVMTGVLDRSCRFRKGRRFVHRVLCGGRRAWLRRYVRSQRHGGYLILVIAWVDFYIYTKYIEKSKLLMGHGAVKFDFSF